MSIARKRADWLIVAGLVLTAGLLSLGLYVACYFRISKIQVLGGTGIAHNGRVYAYRWQAFIFRPAALVESRFSDREVKTYHSQPPATPTGPPRGFP